jgi:hypothetical protein
MKDKITPSDLRAQAEELIRLGNMPKLEDLLDAVGEMRSKYKSKIEAAQKLPEKESNSDED